jgi:hypothetical protein
MRKTLISALMVAVVGLSFASKGGGGEKNGTKNVPLKTNFTPIRTTSGFTLKAGSTMTANYLLGTEKTATYVSFNSLYVMPYKYKINTSMFLNTSGSNMRLLDLRINVNMHK